MDTTTIELRTDQKAQLDDLKHGDESYKSVLQRLIEEYRASGGQLDESRVREVAREEITDRVRREALE